MQYTDAYSFPTVAHIYVEESEIQEASKEAMGSCQ